MKGSEWLARALAGTGMTHVFFVESVLRRTLLELADLGVTPILAHSEKAAAYMADGYARVRRRPGVCMAQSVGAANLASGLQDPYLGRSPVIALTGRKEPSFQHRNAYQEIAHAPLFAAVTKFSTPVDSTSELPRLLRHAWRLALADTPRPTHLDFCGLQGDVIELGETSEPPIIDPEARRVPAHRPIADPADIERAVAALTTARRVAIVAGDGAAASEAGPEVLALAEALAAPVATTLGARGLIPTTHRLSVGVAGSYSAPPANRIVNGADLVLFVGCDTGDQVTLNWRVPARGTPVVQIDADPAEIGRSYPNTTGVLGDPKATLARFNQGIGRPARDSGFAEEAARIVADWRATMAPLLDSNAAPPPVERLCAEVTRALPPDGVLVADTGYSGIWTGTMIELNAAGQTYLRALHRRWRVLLSPRGTGDRPPVRHSRHRRRQQQFRVWPEPDRGAAGRRQSAGQGRRAGALRPDRFHRGGQKLWGAWDPRRPGRGDRARAPRSAAGGGAGRRRCRHRYRATRSRAMGSAAAVNAQVTTPSSRIRSNSGWIWAR